MTIDASAPVQSIDGSCEVAKGFRLAGLHCGVKRSRPDLALLVADGPAAAAGVFTSNRVQAPPVRYCREALRSGTARAVVVNSGNANACTGPQGMADTLEMARLVANVLGCPSGQVLVSSTGVIGRRLPMDRIREGIERGVEELGTTREHGDLAARAILTTDTVEKTAARRVRLGAGEVHIGGMAKGSGMIAPDLVGLHATTLAFLTADVAIPSEQLQPMLEEAMAGSFNAITVDGDTSTNDTVLLLASGASRVGLESADDRRIFTEALFDLSLDLAKAVVRDGEGAQRVVEVRVRGARSDADARAVARTVAESPLVKTAFCAGEPNWGRFLMAIGRAGVDLAEESLAVRVNELAVVAGGLGTDHDPEHLRREMTRDEVLLAIDLGEGESGRASVWTCDLTEEYVRINGQYLT